MVDDEDYERVNQYPWYAHVNQSGNWCAEHAHGSPPHKVHLIMHRFIMNAEPGFDVDHRDLDGLNNQKYNLRVCTRSRNLQNRRAGKLAGSNSGFKGVYRRKDSDRFTAYIRPEGEKRICLGSFGSAEEAARIYDAAAIIHHGEFARLNFPESAT